MAIKVAHEASRDELATKADVAELRSEIRLLEERLSHQILKAQLASFFATAGLILGLAKYLVH